MGIKTHHHNETFFRDFTPLNCYWAGFFAADGSICERNHSIRIALASKDLDHLVKFKKDIESTSPILEDKKTKSHSLCIYSAERCIYDLENGFNIISNKTLVLKPPYEVPDGPLLKSFWVGFIDGDGCIKYCKRDRSIILDVFSASFRFINWFGQEVDKEYGFSRKKIYSYGERHNTYRRQGSDAIKVLHDLQQYGERKLSRKWDKVKNYELGLL